MKQKVVVIGHGYTSRLGIIRSLGAIGCEITVVAMVFHNRLGRIIRFEGGKPIDCHSKYVRRVLYCPAQNGDALVRLLLDRCIDPKQKVIIIPDSDFSAAIIDKNQEVLSPYFLFPHIGHRAGEVERWMDKTVQKQTAREVGLNVAGGVTLCMKDGHYTMPTNVSFPCFTKPLATISGGKQFLRRCNNEKELQGVLDEVARRFPNTEVLIEDFKTIDTEYAVVGFSDGNNVVIPGVIEFIVNSKSHFGIAREGKIMPVAGFESLLEQFGKYVRKVGFCGLFDIDFYESDGEMFFGEMNLRFGGSGYAYTVMGVNLPAVMVRSFRGEDYSDLLHIIDHTATYVNERMCVDDYMCGFVNRKQCKQIIANANIKFVYDKKDCKPSWRLHREFLAAKIRWCKNKILKEK